MTYNMGAHNIEITKGSEEHKAYINKLCNESYSDLSRGIGYPRCETFSELLCEIELYENTLADSIFIINEGTNKIGMFGFLYTPGEEDAYLIGPILNSKFHDEAYLEAIYEKIMEAEDSFKEISAVVLNENTKVNQLLQKHNWNIIKKQIEMKYNIDQDREDKISSEIRILDINDSEKAADIAEVLGHALKWENNYKEVLNEYLEDTYKIAYKTINNKIAGAVIWGSIDDTNFGRLEYIGTKFEYRNKGIASQLIDYVLQDCMKEDLKEVYLCLDAENTKAHSLYSSKGFKETVRSIIYKHI